MVVKASIFGLLLASLFVLLALWFLSPALGPLVPILLVVAAFILLSFFLIRNMVFVLGWVLGILISSGLWFIAQLIRGIVR